MASTAITGTCSGGTCDDPIFEEALRFVLAREGGFSDDPDDPGGATKFGISLRLARQLGDLDGDGLPDLDLDGDGDVDVQDIQLLTRERAAPVYRRVFWDRYRYGGLVLPVARRVFALSVNAGPVTAHTVLQRACRAAGEPIAEDGKLGPITFSAVLMAGDRVLVPAFRSEAAGFYRELVARNPRSAKWLNGWLNRAYS